MIAPLDLWHFRSLSLSWGAIYHKEWFLNSLQTMVIHVPIQMKSSENTSLVWILNVSMFPSRNGWFYAICWDYPYTREIHPLDPQPHRHSMLVPSVCAPRVTRCSLGKYWSCDRFRRNFSLTQGLWNQQAANPGVRRLSMTHSGVRQRNLMTHAVPTPCLLLPALHIGL